MIDIKDGSISLIDASAETLTLFNSPVPKAPVIVQEIAPKLTMVIDGTAALENTESAEIGAFMVIREGAYPEYTGETEFTPSEETQTISTKDKSVLENITINPVPVNYGRLRWEGNKLIVY